jgi:hypothetical protein
MTRKKVELIGELSLSTKEHDIVWQNRDEIYAQPTYEDARTCLKNLLGRDFTEEEMTVLAVVLSQMEGNPSIPTYGVIKGVQK